MKRPLFLLMIGLVLGEAAAISFGWKGGFLLILLFLPVGIVSFDCAFFQKLSAGSLKKRRNFFRMLFLSAVLGFFLSMAAFVRKDPVSGLSFPVKGKISGKVIFLKTSQEGKYTITLHSARFLLEGEDAWKKVNGDCRILQVAEDEITLLPGDHILCTGSLEELAQPTNPGEFNSEVYYRSNGISCQFFADSCLCTEKEKISLRRAAYQVKEKMNQVYQAVLNPEEAALLKAMVLGDKSDLSDEQKRSYEENGAAHLLAVSGLHVSIAAGLWFRFLRKRKVRYLIACSSGCLLLLFYGCLTGFGNSVTRAAFMYAVYLVAEYVGAYYDMISAMSLAAIFMLIESPWRLLEGGFQISFTAILALGLVLPWVTELDKKRPDRICTREISIKTDSKRNPLRGIRAEILEDGRIVRFPELRKKARSAWMASLVVTGVTLPVLLHVFFECCPYSIFLNMVLIPAMTP
ncbi:MAG: competence protein ComEC family protein, partial [Clostridiales bacterium]|nr:competence protein ComEC family protein [Clostridiales bacterium]